MVALYLGSWFNLKTYNIKVLAHVVRYLAHFSLSARISLKIYGRLKLCLRFLGQWRHLCLQDPSKSLCPIVSNQSVVLNCLCSVPSCSKLFCLTEKLVDISPMSAWWLLFHCRSLFHFCLKMFYLFFSSDNIIWLEGLYLFNSCLSCVQCCLQRYTLSDYSILNESFISMAIHSEDWNTLILWLILGSLMHALNLAHTYCYLVLYMIYSFCNL